MSRVKSVGSSPVPKETRQAVALSKKRPETWQAFAFGKKHPDGSKNYPAMFHSHGHDHNETFVIRPLMIKKTWYLRPARIVPTAARNIPQCYTLNRRGQKGLLYSSPTHKISLGKWCAPSPARNVLTDAKKLSANFRPHGQEGDTGAWVFPPVSPNKPCEAFVLSKKRPVATGRNKCFVMLKKSDRHIDVLRSNITE